MKITAYSNKGPVRKNNEDAIFFSGTAISGGSMSYPLEINTEDSCGCFVVIDGMGGYEGGEKAAQIVAEEFFRNSDGWNISVEEARKRIQIILENAVKDIFEIVKVNPALSGMGAALAGVVLCNDSALIFNCGDCRTFYHRGEYLERLSRDHSIVEELRARGEIDDDAMRTHPLKNKITACVSSRLSDLDIYFRELKKSENSQKFFICSDGVWEALPIEEIENCFYNNEGHDAAMLLMKKLLGLNEKCRDNISFIMIN